MPARRGTTPASSSGSRSRAGWEEGRDKICIADTAGGFGLWVEQLIAESTGKQGKGLVPAPGESPDGPDRQAAEPRIADPYDLGGEFFRWEFAVAVVGAYLAINPFDQPDVQAAKDKTNAVLATGHEPELAPEGSVDDLLAQAHEGDYVCVQAFVEPTPENDAWIADLVQRPPPAQRSASSRTASALATSTRPGSCTRAARTPGCSCRSWTTPATSWRFPASRSGSRA